MSDFSVFTCCSDHLSKVYLAFVCHSLLIGLPATCFDNVLSFDSRVQGLDYESVQQSWERNQSIQLCNVSVSILRIVCALSLGPLKRKNVWGICQTSSLDLFEVCDSLTRIPWLVCTTCVETNQTCFMLVSRKKGFMNKQKTKLIQLCNWMGLKLPCFIFELGFKTRLPFGGR